MKKRNFICEKEGIRQKWTLWFVAPYRFLTSDCRISIRKTWSPFYTALFHVFRLRLCYCVRTILCSPLEAKIARFECGRWRKRCHGPCTCCPSIPCRVECGSPELTSRTSWPIAWILPRDRPSSWNFAICDRTFTARLVSHQITDLLNRLRFPSGSVIRLD